MNLEIHNPVLQASSYWYMPPNKTLYNTLNIPESQSCVDDTFKHLGNLLGTDTYNYYTIKTLIVGGFCPICLLAVISDSTTASTRQLDSYSSSNYGWDQSTFSLSFGSSYYLLPPDTGL